nr:uncharacterized protein LOC113735759 [Coffea arabica]
MVWLVNGGTCDFWYDNWLGNEALFLKAPVDLIVTFRDFITNGEWDVQSLGQYLLKELTRQIVQHPVPMGDGHDEMFWSLTAFASAFKNVCQAHGVSVIHSQVWHPHIPLKISFFMLRLLVEKLPLTNALWKGGIQLASKCLCCLDGATKLLKHVFSEGQMSSPWSKKRRVLFTILSSFICWHIWKAQNKAHYEGTRMCVARVCRDVFTDVKDVVEAQFGWRLGLHTLPRLYEWSRDLLPRYRFQVVGWKAKAAGLLMLNTDGCSKGNPGVSGDGGVLRDAAGVLYFAFSAYFEEASSLRAKALALVMGLCLDWQKRFTNINIQVNSLVLVRILQRRLLCPWMIRREVDEI